MTIIEVVRSGRPALAGEIDQRTESPTCGSPTIFSPGCSSKTHTRSGAQTIVGRPAPNVYSTRPSLPGAGVCFSVIQGWLALSASRAVGDSGTSLGIGQSFGTSDWGPSFPAVGAAGRDGSAPSSSPMRRPNGYWSTAGTPCVGTVTSFCGGCVRFTASGEDRPAFPAPADAGA